MSRMIAPELAAAASPNGQAARPYDLEVAPDTQGILGRVARGDFEDPERFHLRRQAALLSLLRGFDRLLCIDSVRFQPFDYQVETALRVLRRLRGRALLCDEVGLGKTIEAGLVLKEYLLRGLARRVLIITPPALVEQWREELATKFDLPSVAQHDPVFRAAGADGWGTFDRIIVSLATARLAEHREALLAQEYDLVIVDEAHHLKQRGTLGWQLVNQIRKRFLLLLTATPVQNNVEELYTLVTLLRPGQLSTLAAFKREFVAGRDSRRPKNAARLHGLLAEVMVRNTRSQVRLELPRRRATTLRLAFTPPERALYDAVTAFVRDEHPRVGHGDRGVNRFTLQTLQMEVGSSPLALLPTLESMVANPHNTAAQRRRLRDLRELADAAAGAGPGAKAAGLLRLLAGLPEQCLVFTRYRRTLHHLAALVDAAGIPAALYHGGLSAADKDAAIAAFARDRRVLLSTEAGGEGRNLQFCRVMVNFDLPWNPLQIEQRIGRLHRIGQHREVEITNLAVGGTVEDYVLAVLDSKINLFELVVGELDLILGQLEDERDFAEIVADIWMRARSSDEVAAAMAGLGEQLGAARERYRRVEAYEAGLLGQDLGAAAQAA